MAVRSTTGKTSPGNYTIIPSAKKWVFHAIYRLAFLSLYGEHICLLNRWAITDEEDAEYHSFETHMKCSAPQLLCYARFMQYGNLLKETYIICYRLKNQQLESW